MNATQINPTSVGEKTRWGIAVCGALVIVASTLLLFRLPQPPVGPGSVGPAPKSVARVQITNPAAEDAVLMEETLLRDLRPLFLPTRYNASLPEPRREPGRTFLDDQSVQPGIAETDLGRVLQAPPMAEGAGAGVLGHAIAAELPGAGLVGFGRREESLEPLLPRGGYVEVVETASGQRVLGEMIPTAAGIPTAKAWEPVELLASINAAGLATPLIVTRSSGVEEVDTHMRNFLARTFRIGERLPPGIYRIVVGP